MKQKKKRGPIPKTLRGKKRYLVVRFFSKKPLDAKMVFASVQQSLKDWFGLVGLARQKMVFRGFDSTHGLLVLQCLAQAEKSVCAGISAVQAVGLEPVVPSVVLKTGAIQPALDFVQKAAKPAQ